MDTVFEIRNKLYDLWKNNQFVNDTVELIGSTFIVNEDYLIRKPNYDYIQKELKWYRTESLNVNDIEPPIPKIWKDVADINGFINSNYGWCIFSEENFWQYNNVFDELSKFPNSRRGIMLYNRPKMWIDYNKNGRSDFICTISNQFLIRENKLISHYVMRSGDAIHGFNNDVAWAKYIQTMLFNDLKMINSKLELGKLIWTVGSLHVYSKFFYCFEYYEKFGEWPESLQDYKNKL